MVLGMNYSHWQMFRATHDFSFGLLYILLRRKVEVESIFKSVEVKLTRREKASGSLGGGKVESSGRLLGSESGLLGCESRLLGSSRLLASASKLASEKTALVTGIKGVDKGVYTGTVSTVRHASQLVGNGSVWGGGGKVATVYVVGKVSVGGVVGVDEGVEVGVSLNVVVVGDSLNRLLLLGLDKTGSSSLGDGSLDLRGGGSANVRVKGGGV